MRLEVQHVVNVSGGKDSDAAYLKALERGRPFRAVMCDTGNESPLTYEHVAMLGHRTGGPEVEVIRQDFSPDIARRRERLPDQWRAAGVSEKLIDEALAILHPTGVPYLDLVLAKGMFATGVSRKFCTEYLKIIPADHQVVRPLAEAGINVVQWLGIRRDESKKRAVAPLVSRSRGWANPDGRRPALVLYRPLIHWTLGDVLDIHHRHGLPMNPLYAQGFTRVGCFPCVNERKASIALIARQHPEAIDRIRLWEDLVNRVRVTLRHGEDFGTRPTFFPAGTIGSSHGASGRERLHNAIDDVVEWSLTSRGGLQFNLLAGLPSGRVACSDEGWCEE